ncbi:hypothetical protein Tco_0471919, partial [Tanacetum coccineum]
PVLTYCVIDDKGKGAEYHHLKGKRKVHDLANIIKKLEEDFGRLLKAKNAKEVKEAKKASEAKKAKEAKKARDVELKAKKAKEAELKAKKAKKAMQAELKAKKAKEAMLAEVVQISTDEDDDEDPTAPTSIRSRALTASTSTRSKAPTAYTSTRAPIAFTSNAQAASTAPRGYRKIAKKAKEAMLAEVVQIFIDDMKMKTHCPYFSQGFQSSH